jgi:transposase
MASSRPALTEAPAAQPAALGTARSIPGRALASSVSGSPCQGPGTGLPPPISTSVPGTPAQPYGLRCNPGSATQAELVTPTSHKSSDRTLVDHREDLIHSRTADQQRLRWHLHDLWPELEIPAGALDTAKWLGKASRRLARAEQTTRVRVARELVRQITAGTSRIRELETELAALVESYAPQLLAERGCGPLTAAKLIGEIAGADRFATDSKLARTSGAAPIPASSGNTNRHRLDRGGNRQLNCALHRLAINKATWDPQAAAYLARKQAEGKSRKEALRCLKRHLARRVWQHLRAPASGQDPRSNNDTTINTPPSVDHRQRPVLHALRQIATRESRFPQTATSH